MEPKKDLDPKEDVDPTQDSPSQWIHPSISKNLSGPKKKSQPFLGSDWEPGRGRGMRYLKGGALIPLMRGVVHKWNNLLSIIFSHAQVALQKEGEWSLEERREEAVVLLETVERANKINRMIHGILHLPEMQESQAFQGPEQVCVGTVLKDLWEILLCEKNGFRYPVQIKAVPQNFTSLSRAALTLSLTWGVEALLEGIPPSAPGTIEMEAWNDGGIPKVLVCFFMEQGHLPFPGRPLQFHEPFLRFLQNCRIGVERMDAGFLFNLPGVPQGKAQGKPLDLPGTSANL